MTTTVISITMIVFAVVGLGLAVAAVFPRRRGDMPFCRKCGYNLTGRALDDPEARCSECGSRLSNVGVVRGERRVRRRQLLFGIVLLLVGVIPLGGAGLAVLRGVDIYSYLPSRVLVYVLRLGDMKAIEPAVWELRSRILVDEISTSTQQALIELALDEQERPQLREGVSEKIIDMLGIPPVFGAMSESQKSRMYANAVKDVQVYTRKLVRCGDEFPICVEVHLRIPADLFSADICQCGFYCNGEELGEGRAWHGGGCYYISDTSIKNVKVPGSGPLRADFDVELYSGGRDKEVKYQHSIIREVPINVLPADAPDPVRKVRSEKYDALVPHLIWAEPTKIERSYSDQKGYWFDLYIGYEEPHICDLAFEVFAQYNDQLFPLGLIGFPEFGVLHVNSLEANASKEPPSCINIILHSSRDAAARTLGIYEIWDGDLIIRDVPIVEKYSERYPAQLLVEEDEEAGAGRIP